MTEQQKITRVLRLIRLLLDKPKSVEKLGGLLELSKSTTYKYIQLLESIGYIVEKDSDGRRFIVPNSGKEFLSSDEKEALKIVMSRVNSDMVFDQIRKKLAIDSQLPSPEYLDVYQHQENLVELKSALKMKWIVLTDYHSSASNSITDRFVFPFKIDFQKGLLHAYEDCSQQNKTFKISRIKAVKVSRNQPKTPNYKTDNETDIFGMCGDTEALVKLEMTSRAYQLLVEENPHILNYVEQQPDADFPYLLITYVRSFYGIGRFYLGLPGEIKIKESADFIQFLKERIKKYLL